MKSRNLESIKCFIILGFIIFLTEAVRSESKIDFEQDGFEEVALKRYRRQDYKKMYELPEDESWMSDRIQPRVEDPMCNGLYNCNPRIYGPYEAQCKALNTGCLYNWACCSWYCPWPEFKCAVY